MIQNQYFSHTNRQGVGAYERISRVVQFPKGFGMAENLALSLDLEGPDFAMMAVIKLLADDGYTSNGRISRGHRDNILNA